MSYQIPLSMQIHNLDKELRRTEDYLQYYRGVINGLQTDCLERSTAVIHLLHSKQNFNRNSSYVLTPDLTNTFTEIVQAQLRLIGLYQDEEKVVRQMGLNIKEREEVAVKLEQRVSSAITEEGKKNCIKQMKKSFKQDSFEEGDVKGFSHEASEYSSEYSLSRKRSLFEVEDSETDVAEYSNKARVKME